MMDTITSSHDDNHQRPSLPKHTELQRPVYSFQREALQAERAMKVAPGYDSQKKMLFSGFNHDTLNTLSDQSSAHFGIRPRNAYNYDNEPKQNQTISTNKD